MRRNIGFVSTRFAGIDGVSLEASKWAEALERSGHRCFWFAGELEKKDACSWCVPRAHFQDPYNDWINRHIFGRDTIEPLVARRIDVARAFLKRKVRQFIDRFGIDLIIAENALAIPMQVPLGLALSEVIAETGIPTIAHHHDFYWERLRFLVNGVGEHIRSAFPPDLPNVRHVVLNTAAREDLRQRKGLASTIIPNVLDFETGFRQQAKPITPFRKFIGLDPEDIFILQPTRIIERKGIEHSVRLVSALKDHRCKLVISHQAGDEGFEYVERLKAFARRKNVPLIVPDLPISDPFEHSCRRGGLFSLWDVYREADFVTFPSLYEGFGNALLEAIFMRKPILINRYATFVRDIEPNGFDLITMDGEVTPRVIDDVKAVLASKRRRRQMVEVNFRTARRHYGYDVLNERLNSLVASLFGSAPGPRRKANRSAP